MALRLLLDPGGSRLKVAEVEGGRVLAATAIPWSALSDADGWSTHPPFSAWKLHAGPTELHVLERLAPPAAGNGWISELSAHLGGAERIETLDPREHCGFKIGYTMGRPGADRIAAAVACHHDDPEQAAIIIDAGTCITVDLLSPGHWRGGAILPGLDLQADAMKQAGLPRIQATVEGRWMDPSSLDSTAAALGTDTDSALRAGIPWATRRSVEAAVRALRETEPLARVFLTGGDAGHFDGLGGWQTFADPNLVLRGGALLLQELHP